MNNKDPLQMPLMPFRRPEPGSRNALFRSQSQSDAREKSESLTRASCRQNSHLTSELGLGLAMSMRLKMILGMTYPAGSCITVHPESGICAYTASNAVVLFDTLNAKQVGYLNDSKKPLGTINFSLDGKLIVTGESGHKPPVCVWEVKTRMRIARMYGHEFGIKCVAFSPRGDLIVSVGNIYDGFIYTWSWPGKEKLASNRFAEEICGLSFSSDGLFFVTCGTHHIKFWYPEQFEVDRCGRVRNALGDSVLYGRPAVLGKIKMSTFISVVCGSYKTSSFVYIINTAGHIALLSSGIRDIIKLKTIENTKLSSICVHDDLLIVAARDGNVYFCNALSLEVFSTLSPHAVRYCVAEGNSVGMLSNDTSVNTYLCYDYVHHVLSVFSTGGKLTVWDITDPANLIKKLYIYNHCGGITGSDILPMECSGQKKKEIFVTVSCDATIRLWSLDVTKTVCCDGVTIIYTDLTSTWGEVNGDRCLNSGEEEQGDLLTAIKVCEDFIVTGDNQGSVVAYNINEVQVIATNKQHFRGISCLEIVNHKKENRILLLSGGRDRRIVIYDMHDKLKALYSMHIHSSTVTVIKIYERNDRMLLVSCGLDRSVYISACSFHQIPKFTVRFNRIMSSSVIDCLISQRDYSLCFGTLNGDIIVFSVESFTTLRSFSCSNNINTRLDKIALDSSSTYLLCACSDRTINVLNYRDGTILASTRGPSVSGLHFSVNNRCAISSSTDGCIFVWGLSSRYPKKSSSLDLNRTLSKSEISASFNLNSKLSLKPSSTIKTML